MTNHLIYPVVVEKADEAQNKSVTKNCTLPKWLRDAGEEAGLNFSQLLQASIKDALKINESKL
ncbi:hypothetical protein [Syntrophobotulus glycolicus]|uniref:hypothetical protein n=1 Tax=Syntrophobotulus glycolicus TaxID=51197 RepID=UPI0003140478|nr:hypothetical protein [Syntrophobotulus glycolicus]